MDAKSRLRQYVKYKGISQNEFTNTAGLANGYLTKRGNVTSEHVAKIGEKYRDLNLEWVITGKGYMTKEGQVEASYNYLNLQEEKVEDKFERLLKEYPESGFVIELARDLFISQNNTIKALSLTVECKDRFIEKLTQELYELRKESQENKKENKK